MTLRQRIEPLMPENSRQHFVPASYLKFFTAELDRRSTFFVHDGRTNTSRPSSPNAECAEYDFYGRGISVEEDSFRVVFENDYPFLAQKILAGERLTDDEKLQFFLFMIHLYARNPSYLNTVPEAERMTVFEQTFNSIATRLIPVRSEIFSEETMRSSFTKRWVLRFLDTRISKILTTDNPCSLLSHNRYGTIGVFMPVSPSCVALALRRKYARFESNRLTRPDIQFLQASIYGQRNRWSYCDFNMGALRGHPAHKMGDSQRPYFHDGRFQVAPCIYSSPLSFVRIVRGKRIPDAQQT